MGVYTYEVGSAIKLNRNYGRLYFDTDQHASDAINYLNTAMKEGVTKSSLGKKIIDFEKKAFSTEDIEDLTSISFTLYNSVNTSKQQRFYFPGVEVIKDEEGNRDDQAMQTMISNVAHAFIDAGVMMADGTVLDRYLVPGLPRRGLDVTREDTTYTDRTP